MKTKETSTLYTTMSNNIGQFKKENAQEEIERLNKQGNTKSWRIDESDFMFVEDETDEHVHNPCERIEGYVWITCEPFWNEKIEPKINSKDNTINIKPIISESEVIGEKIVEYCKQYEGTNKYNDVLKAIEFGYQLSLNQDEK